MTHHRLASLLAPLAAAIGVAACVPVYDPYYVTAPAAPAYATPYAAAPYAAAPYAAPMPNYVGEGEYDRSRRAYPSSGYAAPMPNYVGEGEYDRGRRAYPGSGYAAAPAADPYCREAYAAVAGAQREAAITGSYEDAARAGRTEGFYRRDC